jgi:hypothetical protein
MRERPTIPSSQQQLCAALQVGAKELLSRVTLAFAEEEEWCDRLRSAAHEMLLFFCEDHERARMMTVGVFPVGARAQLIRDQGVQGLIELIDQGRQELDDPSSMTRATAQRIGDEIYRRLHMAIAADRFDELAPMVPELMHYAVLPYVGSEIAMQELSIPPPAWAERR